MSYNHEKNWFEYKGRHYGYGTIVKLKPEMYKGIIGIEKRNGIMKFTEGLTNGNMFFTGAHNPEGWSKVGRSGIWNPNDIIEYIVKPVYVELQPVWKKAVDNYSKAKPEHRHLAFTGTIWYIIVMIVGTLFYERWLIYIVATIIYWNYWVNKYRD
jgi:hypothetical protein